MLLRTLLVALVASFASLHAQAKPDLGESLRVMVTGRIGLQQALSAQGVSGDHVVLHRSRGWENAKITVGRSELRELRAKLPPGTLIMILEQSQPFMKIVEAASAAAAMTGLVGYDPGYHTRAEVVADLQALEQSYPSLCKVYDLQSRYGAPLTHDGFKIYALRISNAPDQEQDKPNVVVSSNTHSGELATIEVPLYTAAKLLSGYGVDPVMTQLVDDNQIWIVPNLNPDGLEYVWNNNNLWRKNRRDNGDGSFGVDMNRNYPFFWSQCGSSSSTTSNTYHGPGPASEPEVQALLMFAEAEGFERLLDVHCAGPDVRHPYNQVVEPLIPSMVRAAMDPIHNNIANAMGYPAVGTCCCGTLMEWHFSTKGTMSFLVEFAVCTGPFTQTSTELDIAWPGVLEYMLAPVPLTGHVTSSNGGVPLQASITVAGEAFQHGQTVMSGGRFGRYHLWGGPGTWDVTFTAPDHLPLTTQLTLTAGQTLLQDVVLQAGQVATHVSFGAGCAGSALLPANCVSLNASGGTLSGHSSQNEYAYRVQAPDAITVTGFRLFTNATAAAPTTVAAGLYLATTTGTPEPTPVATGTMTVDVQPGFYDVVLNTPTSFQAGEQFYIASDTGTIFTSTINGGTPGSGYWRRPPTNPNWSPSSVVQFPAYELVCSGGGQPGAVPALSSNGTPAIAGSFSLELSDAVANAPAVLMFGNSNTQWSTTSLPLTLQAFGAPGCDLLVALDITTTMLTDAGGEAALIVNVPNLTALLDVTFYTQFAVLDLAANAMGFAFSNGGEGVIGH
jgi:hypothetical protein